MNVEGITWHAIVLDPEPFAATRALLDETFGLAPAVDTDGFVQFVMPNGTALELYAPQAVPGYGYNDGGVAFAYRLAAETGKDAYELERRLGHGSQRYIQRYTNPPEDVAAGYVEEF